MKTLFRLLCIFPLSLAALAAQAETYAVMIGINDYPDVLDAQGKPVLDKKTGQPLNDDLRGCVNDVKSYQSLLVDKYGMKKENIHTLLDKDANRANFLKEMGWLIGAAKPGDQVMFFYSGHGTQYGSTKEADGKEEAIVLADECLVTGNYFHEVSQDLSKAGMNATFVFDSCFSGGMTRPTAQPYGGKFNGDSYFPRQKAVDYKDLVKPSKMPDAPLKSLRSTIKKKGAAQGGSYAFLLASSEKEPSIDMGSSDPKVESHGAFTYLFEAYVEANLDAPIEAIILRTASDFKDAKVDQTPGSEYSSEARAHLPFFLKG